MKAIRRFTVRTVLPEPLRGLEELIHNLRWSWHNETLDLFRSVDPALWEAVGRDPVRLLGEIPPERLASLSEDRRFLRRLQNATEELNDYLTAPRWYQGLAERDADVAPPSSIAYFSPEYGIAAALPQYSGGLGILAGDHLKTASDMGVPIIAVGLLYRHGYFSQSLSPDGWQLEHYPAIDPNGLPLRLLRHADGHPVHITIGMPPDAGRGGDLRAQVWLAQVGRVPQLLLDSDVEENDQATRDITDRLYGGGGDHRLLQEMLLGIGGVRAIRAYCEITGHPAPEVFHTNEGHAGFLGLERIRELVSGNGLTFDEALEAVRAGTVFTTHTPVPAGIDRFPRELIQRYFGGSDVPVERILELGAETYPGGDRTMFNMAVMGMRLAQRVNGVSELHGRVSREMFGGLWGGFDTWEVPIGSITNGVHAGTWVAREMFDLAAREVPSVVETGRGWDAVRAVPPGDVWRVRRVLRERLVHDTRRRLRESWRARGASEAEMAWIGDVLDPDVLTIGFARRVPSYKRLTLMLRDPDRLRALLLDPERPVQIVIAGKAHPADEGGKRLIQEIVRFSDGEDVRHRIVFLPDYDIDLARVLVQGCDVWLNNPLRPLEASGTSGMKAALNGALNLSIRDGWWDEWYDGQNGWAIPSADGLAAPDRRDALEAAALYDLIQDHVAVTFYDRDSAGLPRRWLEMVEHTIATLGPKVLATRMLRDYVEKYYLPAAASARAMSADGYEGARALAAWKQKVAKAWPAVAVEHVETAGDESPHVGARLSVRVVVELGDLDPSDVTVEVVYGRVDESDSLIEPSYVELTGGEPVDGGGRRYVGEVPLNRSGAFGYSVRVLPRHPMLPGRAEMGLVVVPPAPVGMTNGDLR
ncbi:alpha-1,4 glucan phosphorylase [Actinomadura sp. NBRC 104412]|uniref:alpha-glucan family phosphorylase n=1 Tax=Actinomadura sp. NBRC 104412 TaxID=3032203 RepID=UPI0024A2EA83|nr:alpha-glucan family phosphorylase [Actinomadura sp. NBRC 104412]GLZ05345.1 alpha-1,4 glucan phosphorylase [Actinomadura sp. NBRC 104412]